MTLTVLRTGQLFCRMSLRRDLSDVFLMIKFRLLVFERKTQRQIIYRKKYLTADFSIASVEVRRQGQSILNAGGKTCQPGISTQ